MTAILIPLLLLAVYLFPTIIVMARNHHNAAAISLLNLVLGWTGVGWFAALALSLGTPPDRK